MLLKRFSLCFLITENATTLTLEDDLLAEPASTEDEDELTQEKHGLKDLWERDEGEESLDEHENKHEDEAAAAVDDEDEDEDADRPNPCTLVLMLAVVVVAVVLVRTRMKWRERLHCFLQG